MREPRSGGERARRAAPPSRRHPLALRAALAAVVLVAGWFLLLRPHPPGEIAEEALAAARSAGCDPVERPVEPEPSREHLSVGQAFAYADPPAAAGVHDPRPLPAEPSVYDRPVEETRAVHNLEHAFVLIWYRPTADAGLAEETVRALEALARAERSVIVAPYAGLPDGRSLALLAWNVRWMCPSGVTPGQATAVAGGFIDAFRGTSVAPEAPRGILGPLFQ